MLNKVILIGRLTSDPEVKHTSSGLSVTSFSVAINRRGKDAQTDFIDVVAWRNTAEFIGKYFSKGMMIQIEGSLQTRTYEDKNGNKRKIMEVVAFGIDFAESKRDQTKSEINQRPEIMDSDDLPF